MKDIQPQPPPIATDSEPIYRLVMADVEAKAEVGHAKYGTYLQADNGRDHLADAYQEAIDLTKYLKAAIIERGALLNHTSALQLQLDEARERLAEAERRGVEKFLLGFTSTLNGYLKHQGEMSGVTTNQNLDNAEQFLCGEYPAAAEERGADRP